MTTRDRITQILAEAGININGAKPHDLQIYDDDVFLSVLTGGSQGIGQAFVDRKWDMDDLAEGVARLRMSGVYRKLLPKKGPAQRIYEYLTTSQRGKKAYEVGRVHYDIGNDLYQATFGKYLVYSQGLWKDATTLEEAQEAKFERVCQRLNLQPGDRVLDIGCGWGDFMKYAAQHYRVSCVGLTISKEQYTYGTQSCAGLPVEFVLADYREYVTDNHFDHVVSLEMLEAVGPKNFKGFFQTVYTHLTPEGDMFLQTSASRDLVPYSNTWIHTNIFPNGVLPSLWQIHKASRKMFTWKYLEDVGSDYDRTLMEWWKRFDAAYPELVSKNSKYDEKFYRMWKFYLQSCAGFFRAGDGQNLLIQMKRDQV